MKERPNGKEMAGTDTEPQFGKPDFIGIGPPKTGTTWIYENLRVHPDIAMPPDKEIRYFWERVFVGRLSLKNRFTSTHWHIKGRRAFHRNRLRSHWGDFLRGKLRFSDLRWDVRYFFWAQTDSWYSSLFQQQAISGDISAKYCELPEQEIARIKRVFPALKVLITLRDPIEREWSRAKMNLCKKPNRSLDQVSFDEFVAQFNDPPQKQANDYRGLIERWQRHFGQDQILVLFHDELLEAPYHYFCRICDFLGIGRPTRETEKQLKEVVFKGIRGKVPSELKQLLFAMHREYMEQLVDFWPDNDYPLRWLAKYR